MTPRDSDTGTPGRGRRLCLAAFLGSSLCTAELLLGGACGGSLGLGQHGPGAGQERLRCLGGLCSHPGGFISAQKGALVAAHCLSGAEPEHGGVWCCWRGDGSIPTLEELGVRLSGAE